MKTGSFIAQSAASGSLLRRNEMTYKLKMTLGAFVEFCRKHGHALAGHKEFWGRAVELEKMIDEIQDAIEETCEWTYDDYHDCWETSCKNAWVMTEGGSPLDNEYKFCPACGKQIVVKESDA
jgi:hypothetical protein